MRLLVGVLGLALSVVAGIHAANLSSPFLWGDPATLEASLTGMMAALLMFIGAVLSFRFPYVSMALLAVACLAFLNASRILPDLALWGWASGGLAAMQMAALVFHAVRGDGRVR